MENKTGNFDIQLAKPSFSEEELLAVQKVLESGWVTQGPETEAFERDFLEAIGANHAVAVSNGTGALYLSLLALGIGTGDEVILPSFSWIATANAISLCGAQPVFADVNPDTYNLDPESLSMCMTKNTKAIVAVHQFGLCAEMDKIIKAAGEVPVLEDAACALGSTLNGQSPGSWGTIATFSFHPRKVITTGEGGMITTKDSMVADRLRSLRNHGMETNSDHEDLVDRLSDLSGFERIGTNLRMSDILATIGREQLKKLPTFIAKRSSLAIKYSENLKDLSWLALPRVAKNANPNWQSFVCQIVDHGFSRKELIRHLLESGIESRPASHAAHLLSPFKRLSSKSLPVSEEAHHQAFSLPIHDGMSDDDLKRVCEALHSFS